MNQCFTYSISSSFSFFADIHTFSAKEKDTETGLSYFGSRYYSSDLSIWLSVDPMSDKYPSLSPYVYCANNPIKMVDPNGEEVIITGDGAEEAVDQLQCTTKNLIISRDAKTGKLSVEGKARTWEERLLKRSINSTNVKVRIKANYDNLVENDPKVSHRGGAFLGNVIVREEGKKPYVIANQVINPELLCEEFDNHGEYMGESVRHEITEAYMGGVISLRRNKPASMQTQTSRSRIYNAAHNRATPQPNYSIENNNQQIPIDLSKIKFIKNL